MKAMQADSAQLSFFHYSLLICEAMNLQKIRADFPILSREVYGKPLVYLDNGATTQKPRQVVDAITDEYYSVNANVHRGVPVSYTHLRAHET